MLRVLVDAMLVDGARRVAGRGGLGEERFDRVGQSRDARALERDAAAGVVDRREHVVVLAGAEEDAEAAADDRVVLEALGGPGKAEPRREIVAIRVVPWRPRRAEA